MKIAYVTTYDARDPSKWSGTGHYIARALEGAGCELEYLGPLQPAGAVLFKAAQLLCNRVLHRQFDLIREPFVLKSYARQLQARLEHSDAQVIFSPSTHPVARLNLNRPIVTWTDATFPILVREYRWDLPPCARTARNGLAQERDALKRAALALYSSHWAADSAVKECGADPAKVKVVPFGANITSERTESEVEQLIAARPKDRCQLIYIGTGWQRKGGDIALAIAEKMNRAGLPTTLAMLGQDVPGNLPAFAQRIGFIDKRTPQGQKRFDDLLGSSHFLLAPARAEAYGIIFCEAGSYGVPSLSTAVGGIPTIIREGVNGFLAATGDDLAETAMQAFRSQNSYQDLARQSFREYETRLNWRVIGVQVKELLKEAAFSGK